MGTQVREMGVFLVNVHLRQSLKISGDNVDEEDVIYLKMRGTHVLIINIYVAPFLK